MRDLLRRAAEYAPILSIYCFQRCAQRDTSGRAGPPPAPSPGPAHSAFGGGGHVLGGEDFESRYVPDPLAERASPNHVYSLESWLTI